MVHPLYAVMAFTCALVSVLISAGVLGGLDKNNISDKKFIILTRWTVSFCCMDGIWGLFASHILCNDTILLILSSLNHICAAFTAVGWLSFVLSYLNIRKKRNAYLISAVVLVLIQVMMVFVNNRKRFLFDIDADGIYIGLPKRQLLFYMQYAIYVVIGALCVLRLFGAKDPKARRNYASVTLFVTAPIGAGICQLLWSGVPFYSIGYMLGCIIINNFIVIDLLQERLTLTLNAEREKERIAVDRQYLSIVDGLASDYQSVFEVNLKLNSVKIHKTGGGLYRLFGGKFEHMTYEAAADALVSAGVCKDDRALMHKVSSIPYLREKLTGLKYFKEFFRNNDGAYTEMKCVRIEDCIDHVIIGFSVKDEEIRRDRERRKELEDALALAKSAGRAKTFFFNNVSRDFRIPMNTIMSDVRLAIAHIDQQDQVEDYLRQISKTGEHLLGLMNDVLDMSLIESGRMVLHEKAENLPQLIYTLRDKCKPEIRAKQQLFSVTCVEIQNENIYCDRFCFNRVLLNLLSFAGQNTPVGGKISINVSQKTPATDGYADYEIIVKDDGIGMSKEMLKNIFEPFTCDQDRIDPQMQRSDLGMSISKRITELMGGEIEVRSEPNQGTDVILKFRFKVAEEDETVDDFSPYAGCRVLVIDDDTDCYAVVSELLSEVGMIPDCSVSAEDALQKVSEARDCSDLYRLFLVNWQLPDINGLEMTRRLRRLVGEGTPVILMTDPDWSEIEWEARSVGIMAFLRKPISRTDLFGSIRAGLGNLTEKKAF